MAAFTYVDFAKVKRGLAVVINNSRQNIPTHLLRQALLTANYEIEMFENISTVESLGLKISKLEFPPFVNQKFLDKIKKGLPAKPEIRDNRKEIYSSTFPPSCLEMLSDMNMYGGSSAEKNLDTDVTILSSSETTPSLLVIYLGEGFYSDGLLIRDNDSNVVISRDYFINLFRRDFTDIPTNVSQIFMFVTIGKEKEIDNFHYYIQNEKQSKNNNTINIKLRKKEDVFQKFIPFFTNFMLIHTKGIKGINDYLKEENDLIESYDLNLHTHFKFQNVPLRYLGLKDRSKVLYHILSNSSIPNSQCLISPGFSYKKECEIRKIKPKMKIKKSYCPYHRFPVCDLHDKPAIECCEKDDFSRDVYHNLCRQKKRKADACVHIDAHQRSINILQCAVKRDYKDDIFNSANCS